MRRGETARVFDEVRNMRDLYRWFIIFLKQLQHKALTEVASHDPNLEVRGVRLMGARWGQAGCNVGLW